jgi:hypothetical protein
MHLLDIFREIVAIPGPCKGDTWISDQGIKFDMIEIGLIRVTYPDGEDRQYKINQHPPPMLENLQ